MDVELVVTSDGSHTLFNPELNENYHSTHGALQESQHVFIKSGFDHVRERLTVIRILEVGFGTGLNALLSIAAAEDHHVRVEYAAVEAFPLNEAITNALNYPDLVKNPAGIEWFSKIHNSPWNQQAVITQKFSLRKTHGRIHDLDLGQKCFDLVYFDAFAPQKQPDMWTLDVLTVVAQSMDEGGCLVTYCAKGQVKRDLRAAGLAVESLPGPPGKREMIRATRRST